MAEPTPQPNPMPLPKKKLVIKPEEIIRVIHARRLKPYSRRRGIVPSETPLSAPEPKVN